MKVSKHIGKRLLTIKQFADMRSVTVQGVYWAINNSNLPVVHVGVAENIFIDPSSKEVKNYKFKS